MKTQGTKKVLILFIIGIIAVTLTGCSKQSEEEKLSQKAIQEIEYLDTKLVSIVHDLNNIELKNYVVKSESSKASDSQEQSGGSNSKQESETSNSGEGATSEQSDSSKESGSQNSVSLYKVEPNNILSNSRQPDWSKIKIEIENLYTSWSTMVVDLYKLNIKNEDITNFSNDLNTATTAIKAEDKTASLNMIAKLYSYIPIYVTACSQDQDDINTAYTKAYTINAYTLIEQDKWDEIGKNLEQAERYFSNVVNNIEGKQKQYNINKTYILLKEFQNAVPQKDKDLLYIKYKNLMEELNTMNA